MSRVVSLVRSLAIIIAFFGAVAVIVTGTWYFMPGESRAMIRDPRTAMRAAERGVRGGPVNPITALGEWLLETVADLRDRTDVVIAADGTNGGITPLPPWTSADTSRYFGATETLWQSRRAKLAGVRWSRVVFFWSDVQPGGPRDWRAHFYLRDTIIQRERANGMEVVGLLMGTPAWAARDPEHGVRSVPLGLDRPIDDPQNVWAAFVRRMAATYRGRIDTWIIWNEPDIRPGDPNAQYHAWGGDDADYARLLAVAYQAAKEGNPDARIVFGATTYWSDANAGRTLFLERVLERLAADPDARQHHHYIDAVALNLYTSPDDLARIAGVYRAVLHRYGSTAPLWLTETNAVPYDDPDRRLRREADGLRVTMDQQAAFVVQAFAMGLAAGYERLAFHSTMDRSTEDELWGLVRNDGTLRPAFVAYQTAARYLSGGRALFAGAERPEWRWTPDGYFPNWQAYLVVIERAAGSPFPMVPGQSGAPPTSTAAVNDRQRVSVIWNGDGEPLRVALPRHSERAALVDKYGRILPLAAEGDQWMLVLPAAAARNRLDPEGYFFVGGDPLILVEDGVSPGAPVTVPTVLGAV